MRATVEMFLSTTLQFPLHHLLPPAAFLLRFNNRPRKCGNWKWASLSNWGLNLLETSWWTLVNSGQMIAAAAV